MMLLQRAARALRRAGAQAGTAWAQVQQLHVMIQGKQVYTCVRMDDFLVALAEKARPLP